MTKLAIATLLASTAFGALTLTAMAEHHGQHGKRGGAMLEQLDTDGDGNITQAEIDASKAARFAEADANGDGSVSLEEFTAHHAAMKAQRQAERQQRRFDRLDADGDGLISAEEHAAHASARTQRMFSRIDTDSDGVITQAERDAAKARMKEHRGKRRGMHREGPTPEQE